MSWLYTVMYHFYDVRNTVIVNNRILQYQLHNSRVHHLCWKRLLCILQYWHYCILEKNATIKPQEANPLSAKVFFGNMSIFLPIIFSTLFNDNSHIANSEVWSYWVVWHPYWNRWLLSARDVRQICVRYEVQNRLRAHIIL